MLKKTGIVVGLLGMFALSALLMSCGTSRPSGLLYVVSQSLDNVSSFAINLDNGDLSLITNDLAPTCPDTTCGSPLTISIDPTGATAFVLGQSALSGLPVNSDGSMGQPTKSASFNQTALAMTSTTAGDMLFVITTPQNPSLTNEPQILAFSTNPGSTSVTPLTSTSLSVVPTGLSVITFTPPSGGSTQTLLFVTSNLDLNSPPNDYELSVFNVDSSGNLTEEGASPYTAQAPNPLSVIAVNTNPPSQSIGGVFVYVGSQGAVTGSLSSWEVCTQIDSSCNQGDVNNGNLAVVGTPVTVGENPIAMLTDPTSTFLYIACNVGNNVYAFKMATSTGVLTALSPALQPAGAGPVSLAMHGSSNNSNEYLYVSNNVASTLSGYIVSLTTGDLSNPLAPLIFTAGNPYGMAGR